MTTIVYRFETKGADETIAAFQRVKQAADEMREAIVALEAVVPDGLLSSASLAHKDGKGA